MIENSQIIIIGGGASIREGISKGLWDRLQGKITFGLNYSFNFFIATAQFFVDSDFYEREKSKMKDLPLIIGNQHQQRLLPNTITKKTWGQYDPTLKKGVYKASLCGLYALSIAVFLKPKEIFLLGYDFGGKNEKDEKGKAITHFYQGQIEHKGIGRTSYYDSSNRGNLDFKVYPTNNIFNVSMTSKIDVFPKISYDEFFTKLNSNIYNQDLIRQEIKAKLQEV